MTPSVRPARARYLLGAASLLLLAALLQAVQPVPAEAASPLLYLPSGRSLKMMSLGFDSLLADALYLWSIQYYSNYRIEDRYQYLDHIYTRIITDLDPHYLDAYLTGALIMTAEARQPESALKLLDKGIAANPDAWILSFEAGYLCYNDLKDYARAASYFETALRAKDVHPLVKRFHAEMYNRAGDKHASLREWSAIYETASDDYVRTVAGNHVHELRVQVDLADLEEAIGRFRERSGGAPPRRLAQLVSEGCVAALPLDPEGRPYDYVPATGRVGYSASQVLGR